MDPSKRPAILTLFMRRIGFQFYILLPEKSGSSVTGALDSLQDLCDPRLSRLFGIVLTDRESEFADAERIERGRDGRE